MNWSYLLVVVIAAAIVALERYAIPALKAYLSAKNADLLAAQIAELVAAAEQLFPERGQGPDKLSYVLELLGNSGIDTADRAIRAKVEAAVYALKGGSE